jgi:hypothetical protein
MGVPRMFVLATKKFIEAKSNLSMFARYTIAKAKGN